MSKEFNADNVKKYDTDDELFAALMEKDELAKKQFYYDKIRLLYWLASRKIENREDAEYLARLAFSRTLASQAEFKDLKHITRYMCKAVRFACLDYVKRLKAKKNMPVYNIPLEKVEEALADEQQVDEDYIRAECLNAVYVQINKLPELDRKILLQFATGKTTAEIAEELGCTPRQVRDKLRLLPGVIKETLIKNKIIAVLLLMQFI